MYGSRVRAPNDSLKPGFSVESLGFFRVLGAKYAPLRLTKGQFERRGGPDVTVVPPYAAALFGADAALFVIRRPWIDGEERGDGGVTMQHFLRAFTQKMPQNKFVLRQNKLILRKKYSENY